MTLCAAALAATRGRGAATRRRFVVLRAAASMAQLLARRRFARAEVKALRDARVRTAVATLVQTTARGAASRREAAFRRQAGVALRRGARGFVARRLYARLAAARAAQAAADTAAKALQSRRRGAAIALQTWQRQRSARRELQDAVRAVITLQTNGRRSIARTRFLSVRAVIVLQSSGRRILAARAAAEAAAAVRCAVALQRRVRGGGPKRRWRSQRRGALVAQTVARRVAEQRRFHATRKSVVRVQAAARRFLAVPPPVSPVVALAEEAAPPTPPIKPTWPAPAWARRSAPPTPPPSKFTVGVDLGGAARATPLVDLFGAARTTPVVDLLGAGPRTVAVDLARAKIPAPPAPTIEATPPRHAPPPRSPMPEVTPPRHAPVIPPLQLPAIEDDAPSVEVPPPKEVVKAVPAVVKRVRLRPPAAKQVKAVAPRLRKSRKRRTAAGAAAAAAQLLRQLNDLEETVTRAEGAVSEPPTRAVEKSRREPAHRRAWRRAEASLAAGDGEAAVAAVLSVQHARTTARLLARAGPEVFPQLSDATLDALLCEVASLLRGDYRAYALPWVAGAAKAGALNRASGATRSDLTTGLSAAANQGDGDALYASKLLARVELLA